MNFDPTISLGAIISTLGFVISVLVIYGRLARKLGSLETKIESMWNWWTHQIERRGQNGGV